MDTVKKVYVDSRYRSNDSVSHSDFKFEIKESLDLPDNTVCYVDDICIPHTWYTIGDFNNTFYMVVKKWVQYGTTNAAPKYHGYALKIPNGNYTGTSFTNELQEILQTSIPDLELNCSYNNTRGNFTIKAGTDQLFKVLSNHQVSSTDPTLPDPWMGFKDNNDNVIVLDINNLNSINEVLRRTNLNSWGPMDSLDNEFTSEFLDLLNVHNIYIHSSTLGNYNSIGVRGENFIIKKVTVSSSFGYLVMDSVVAPHDKIDVSRRLIKTLSFSLKTVHGKLINLHGSNVSFSLISQSIE